MDSLRVERPLIQTRRQRPTDAAPKKPLALAWQWFSEQHFVQIAAAARQLRSEFAAGVSQSASGALAGVR
jgi:hypothetical protein